jgi:hypothetical protein
MLPPEAIARAAISHYINRKMWQSVKTTAAYELHVWSYMREYFTGGVDAFGFIDLMAAEIDNQYWRAWREGAAELNVFPEDFTDDDNVQIESMIQANINYLDGIAGDIEAFIAEGNHTDAEFNQRFRARAALWGNGYESVVNDAKLWFGDKEKLEWVYGDAEHCSTCLALNGIVAWSREWNEANVKPQGDMLECGGWQCKCSLQPTTKRRTAGALEKIMDIMTAAHV